MSGAQTTTGPINGLFDPMMALRQQESQNQLLQQQQTIGGNEIEMMSRAAATLMDPSQYPTPEARAAAYPTLVGALQRQGFAKNAPATYPGDDQIAGLARMGMSLKDQYGAGMIISPALKALMDAPIPGVPGYGGVGAGGGAAGGSGPVTGARGPGSATRAEAEGGPPAAGSPGAAVAQRTHDFWIKQGYNEAQVAGIMAGGPGSESDFTPTVFGDKGTSYGLYQHHGERLANMQKYFGLSGSQMPSEDQQNQYAAWEISPQGPLAKVGVGLKAAQTPAEAATVWTRDFGVPGDPTEVGRRARGAGRYMGIYAGQGGAPGGAAAPGSVQQGGAPPAPPGAPAGNYAGGGFGGALNPQYPAPPLPPVVKQQPIFPAGKRTADAIMEGVQQAQAAPGLPGGVAAAGPAAPTATATATQATPEPGWGTGGGVGSYGAGTFGGPAAPAAPPAPPAPVAQTPPPQAQPPAAPPSGTGVNSPQYQAAMALNHRAMQLEALGGNNPVVKARVAELRQQAALMMQADSVIQTPQGQVHTLTGKIDDPAKPLADYHETTPGSGIWVGGPGTEPRFQPPGRLVVGPDGTVWQTGVGGATVLQPSNPAAIAARKAAEASGTAIGTSTGKLPEQLANQGRDAAQAIGNIDYGMSQIAKAKAGGMNTGYFAPWLGTITAIGKSLGIPTEAIGVDPSAVGNIQTAQKTLAVVSGAILQQVLGSDSQITDAKIQHFIHAQPGIETDPDALGRVLNWARSQFVYEHEMATQGMKDASDTGMLPTSWRARYFAQHGFAPIYNPASGEMQQPDGQGPSREPPATVTTAPVNPAAREAGKTYSTPKGPMKWTGTGWVTP